MVMNTSCTTSSASAALRVIPRASRWRRVAYRPMSTSSARQSPAHRPLSSKRSSALSIAPKVLAPRPGPLGRRADDPRECHLDRQRLIGKGFGALELRDVLSCGEECLFWGVVSGPLFGPAALDELTVNGVPDFPAPQIRIDHQARVDQKLSSGDCLDLPSRNPHGR